MQRSTKNLLRHRFKLVCTMAEFYKIDCRNCGKIDTAVVINPANRCDSCICPSCGYPAQVIHPKAVPEYDLGKTAFQTADKLRKK